MLLNCFSILKCSAAVRDGERELQGEEPESGSVSMWAETVTVQSRASVSSPVGLSVAARFARYARSHFYLRSFGYSHQRVSWFVFSFSFPPTTHRLPKLRALTTPDSRARAIQGKYTLIEVNLGGKSG